MAMSNNNFFQLQLQECMVVKWWLDKGKYWVSHFTLIICNNSQT